MTSEHRKQYMREYMTKRRATTKDSFEPEGEQLPIECQRFKDMMFGKVERDSFFMNNHLITCKFCQGQRKEYKLKNESQADPFLDRNLNYGANPFLPTEENKESECDRANRILESEFGELADDKKPKRRVDRDLTPDELRD